MGSKGLAAALLIAAALPASAASAAEVTADRLLHSRDEPQNWLMHLGDYAGSRYSGLDRIDRSNVATLVRRFNISLGGMFEGGGNYTAALPVSPLVEDGYIYIVDGSGHLSKLDGRNSGAVVWTSDAGQQNLDAWLQATRGIAFSGSNIVLGSSDGWLHWIDTGSGELVRSVRIGDPLDGYSIDAPALVVGNRIIVGGGGAARGARGRIDALDALSGDSLWTTFSVPEPGDPGIDTWPPVGLVGHPRGGAFEQTGIYDPATNLTIWGAGHASPRFEEDLHPGGNLFTNSAIAVDVATGEMRWYFQYDPADPFGFSEVGTHQFVPVGSDGQMAVAHFGHNGFYYVLDAADGSFRSATPHVAGIDWTAGIDPDTGRPVELSGSSAVADGRRAPPWSATPGCPNIRSVAAFASAYSPRTGLSYGSGADGCDPDLKPTMEDTDPNWLGGYYVGSARYVGSLAALDPSSGALVAQRAFDFPLHAGVLATAGGLVFTTTAAGRLYALDDETLEPLWTEDMSVLTSVPPVSFAIDGEQYVAVVVGGNALARGLTYRPRLMTMSEPLFVLVAMGLRS